MAIGLAIGTEAHALLRNSSFQQGWKELSERCPWATTFQDLAFVATWYTTFASHFIPAIVSETCSDGRLVGLLTLGVSRDQSQLVVAGANEAEYQVWLATPECGASFIEKALTKLGEELPGVSLVFRYLPPLTPTTWCTGDRGSPPYCLLERQRRPLLVVGDGRRLSEAWRKKSNKSRRNRLQRYGDLRLEQVFRVDDLAAVFDQIIAQYDLRHATIEEPVPFQANHAKKAFYLALMEIPDFLHVTVLKVGDEMVASHVGVRDRDKVYLGIFTFSMKWASYSPGKIHLLMLGELLKRQGYSAVDLTPGGDLWKERFATAHEDVGVLTVFAHRHGLMGHKMHRNVRTLARFGLGLLDVKPQAL